jgi:hypothetical protein
MIQQHVVVLLRRPYRGTSRTLTAMIVRLWQVVETERRVRSSTQPGTRLLKATAFDTIESCEVRNFLHILRREKNEIG